MDFTESVNLIQNKPDIALGLLDLVVGEQIGEGSFRAVYQHATNPDWVVKIQKPSDSFNNVTEYEIWCLVKDTDYKHWFAEVHWISDNGKVIIQQKVNKLKNKSQVPNKIPHFFTDVKSSNFGLIGNQLTCHDYDYSLIRFADVGLNNRMKSAKDIKEDLL